MNVLGNLFQVSGADGLFGLGGGFGDLLEAVESAAAFELMDDITEGGQCPCGGGCRRGGRPARGGGR